ncbi:MAG: HD-GYP domain-containing protein [Acidimicrobiia bacterium]
MNEQPAGALMMALRRAVSCLRLYGQDHPLTAESLAEAAEAATILTGAEGRAVVTLLDDAFYLDRALLAATSLEFNGILRQMQERSIESITFVGPVRHGDIGHLVVFLCSQADDIPPSSAIVLNETPMSRAELDDSEMIGLRSSYASSLDVLRSIGVAVQRGSSFELSAAAATVESLLEQTIAQPGASLLLATVKSHDEYTFYHSVNTCILSLSVGRLVGLHQPDLLLLGMGALLHDIGKIGVSTSVLQYPGRLSPEQWAEIKLHPQEGAQAILAASGSGQEIAAAVAFEHHARYDGSGYPKLMHFDLDGHGGRGDDLPGHGPGGHVNPLHFFSRLVSVADTYDAITTRRSYRRAETPNRALHVLLNAAGSSYDADFVRAFIHMMGVYPPGSILELRGGQIVMVTHHAADDPGQPAAVIVVDAAGVPVENPVPFSFEEGDIIDQLSPSRVGIDPVAMLEKVGAPEVALP